MNRKGNFHRRILKPESKYLSVNVHKLINKFMKCGKKNIAASIVYKALKLLEDKHGRSGAEILSDCIKKVAPSVYLRSKRIASRIYRIPVPIGEGMATNIAIKWIKFAMPLRKEKKCFNRLFYELDDILSDKGEALKKRENYHKVAKDNEAFIHYG